LQLTLDELKNKEDVIVESQGIKVVYDSDIEPYVKDLIVDYSDHWYERGFVLRGARTSSC
jgi:Fe-S cluster assembly iron-binding protein IscA